MNIVILSNADIASNVALNLLLPELTGHQLKLFLTSQVGHQKTKGIPTELENLQFFEQTLFNQILFPSLDLSTDSSTQKYRTFSQLNQYLTQPFEFISDINCASVISEFSQYKPDLIISIRFGLILDKPIIATSKHGAINLHSGLLPQYQGVMPTFRAMLNGDKEIGTSLHFIKDRQIDSGEIISTTIFSLLPECSYLWNVLELYKDGCKEILKAVDKIANNQPLKSTSQQGKACYFSFPDEATITKFKDMGMKLYCVDEISQLCGDYLPENLDFGNFDTI